MTAPWTRDFELVGQFLAAVQEKGGSPELLAMAAKYPELLTQMFDALECIRMNSSHAEMYGRLFAARLDNPDLGLEARTWGALFSANIRTVGDVVRQSREQITNVKGFGKKSMADLCRMLKDNHLGFSMRMIFRGGRAYITSFGSFPNSRLP